MDNKKTLKALDELTRSEYSTATALDAALTEAEDGELRKNYRKWRDSHIRQAEALQGRIKELGGESANYEVRDGNLYPALWSLIRGNRDYRTLAGVRMAAGRGLKHYVAHLDEIDDRATLNILRKNLEAKQNEMRWYDEQVTLEHKHEIQAELDKTRELVATLENEVKEEKKVSRHAGPAPLAAVIIAGAIGLAAYFIARRDNDMYDDAFADQNGYEAIDSTMRTDDKVEA
jgi:hypothetical protein